MSEPDLLERLRGTLIVSCQAYPGEAMLDPRTMAQVAHAAVAGGASAVRLKGLDDIRAGRELVDVPIIGLVKVGNMGVYITPTLADALTVAEAGAHIVALDGTRRTRPDGLTLAETVAQFKAEQPATLLMADCGSLADALAAESAGVDIIGTTLAGYTGERDRTAGPDWELVDQVVSTVRLPVFVEGRVHTVGDAAEAIRRGAHAVVVGTAITHPATIASWFVAAVKDASVSKKDTDGQ